MKLFWISAAFVVLALVLPPVSQPQSYHAFVDDRTLLGIANFWNTASNLPFVLVGLWGTWVLAPAQHVRAHFHDPAERWPYLAFFAAIALTGVGSAWYHLAPDDARLVWDRLPIALACAALSVAFIGDIVGRRAMPALWPALGIGAATVGWWQHTELHGAGNLIPYFALQTYVVAVALYLLLAVPARYSHRGDIWTMLAIWILARVAEWLDAPLYAGGYFLSGHTFKHLLAALAAAWLLRMILRRSPLDPMPVATAAAGAT